MRPHRRDLDAAMPGGFARIFSGLALSRVLEQGYDRTATLASAAATVLRSMPPSIPGTEPVATAVSDEEDEDDDTSRPAPVPTPSGGGNPTG